MLPKNYDTERLRKYYWRSPDGQIFNFTSIEHDFDDDKYLLRIYKDDTLLNEDYYSLSKDSAYTAISLLGNSFKILRIENKQDVIMVLSNTQTNEELIMIGISEDEYDY